MMESLRKQEPDARIWAFCLDSSAYTVLNSLALPGVVPVPVDELLRMEPRLNDARGERTAGEFCLTCKPQLPRWLLQAEPGLDQITFLDADLYFYGDMRAFHDEFRGGSIGILRHDFSPAVIDRVDCGWYNSGCVVFANDAAARECVDWWAERCLEWCFGRIEPGRYTDQKYLEQWPALFDGVVELTHPGANLAPWNLAGRSLTWSGNRVLVNGRPLVFYHFSSLLRAAGWLYNTNFHSWRLRPGRLFRRRILQPYVNSLNAWESVAAPLDPNVSRSAGPPPHLQHRLLGRLKTARHVLRGLLLREYLLVFRGHVL